MSFPHQYELFTALFSQMARIRAKTSTRDAQIAEAILCINTKKYKSIAEAARAFKLDKETLRRRYNGKPASYTGGGHNKALS
jgi:hypothetical protein